MTRPTRCAAWLVALLLAVALPMVAGSFDDQDAERAQWQTQLREALDAVAAAEQRYAVAENAYGKSRHRRNERGGSKTTIVEERDAAKAALPEARRAVADVYDAARHAGVPPGWLRDVQNSVPARQAPADR